jgi:hypothetical protein
VTDDDTWAKIDTSTPNVARVWDYQLGGKDNFEADRAAADAINKVCEQVGAPDGRAAARESRAFIGRAVRYLALEAGIDQFIDLGSGLPTQSNVHEAAQQGNPLARTVYVDYDPMVLAHGRALLADDRKAIVIAGDVREPEAIFADPELRSLIDLRRPTAVLLVAMLHLIPDDDEADAIVARIRAALAPGSYLALTHTTSEHRPKEAAALAAEFARLHVTTPLVPRNAQQIGRFFDGFEIIEPGLISPPRWRPDERSDTDTDTEAEADTEWMYAGVGRLAAPPHQQPATASATRTAPNGGHQVTGPGERHIATNQAGRRDQRRAGEVRARIWAGRAAGHRTPTSLSTIDAAGIDARS